VSNVAGKAYGMNVVTPVRPARTWVNALLFMVARCYPASLGGLLGLSLIHFARWVIIKREQWPAWPTNVPRPANDYMLFLSNFNGTWDQYIDAFADGIPAGLDLFWYASTKYPHSIPITPFKDYIRSNQVDTAYYYNATPGSGQRDIKAALRLSQALGELAGAAPGLGDEAFAARYREMLVAVQDCLGAPGYAPVASNDTANADINRCAQIAHRWSRPATQTGGPS
jgi:hypothetical protein